MGLDDICLRVEMKIPDSFEQHGPGHHLTGMFHEIFEKPELTRLEHDLSTVAGQLVGQPIELEVADAIRAVIPESMPLFVRYVQELPALSSLSL